jgi:hypothetical protein
VYNEATSTALRRSSGKERVTPSAILQNKWTNVEMTHVSTFFIQTIAARKKKLMGGQFSRMVVDPLQFEAVLL